MKRTFALALLLFSLIPLLTLDAQDLTGIERWITSFPKGRTDIAGHRITRSVIERSGALIVLDWRGVPVRINIVTPIALETLTARVGAVGKTVLAGLSSERWTIGVKECEIDLGLKNDLAVTLKFSSFRCRLNQETVIELDNRLEADTVFRHRSADDSFVYTLRFRGIDLGTGNGDAFPGWAAYVTRLRSWFVKGLSANSQEMIALVQETKVTGAGEDGDINLPQKDFQNPRIGLQFAYLMPSLMNAEAFHFEFNPGLYNLLLAACSVSWRNLGEPSWLVKPYRITVSFGAFGEVNAGALFGTVEPIALWPTGPLSFVLACGPAVGVEFTAMIPKIAGDRYSGDLLGIGIELLTVFNVLYFFPDYEYEYFLNQFFNFVFHFLPAAGNIAGTVVGADLILGFNFTLDTLNYEDAGVIHLNKFGITLGARVKLDFPGTPLISAAAAKK